MVQNAQCCVFLLVLLSVSTVSALKPRTIMPGTMPQNSFNIVHRVCGRSKVGSDSGAGEVIQPFPHLADQQALLDTTGKLLQNAETVWPGPDGTGV